MSATSLTLLSFALFSFAPLVSAAYNCHKVSPIDTSCALHIAQTDIINLNFANLNWNKDDWDMYIIQDGKYLSHYKTVITDRIGDLCKGKVEQSLLEKIIKKLDTPFDLDAYGKSYGVDAKGAKDTVLLQKYLAHYEDQKDCYELLSASLPCLCIYPAVAKVVKANNGDTCYADSRTTWIKDNISSGSTCSMVQEAVGENLRNKIYDESMRFELDFFNLKKDSELALNNFVPKEKKTSSEDL